MFNLKRKVLFGLSVSMVLAMAVGSFALNETQTPASPQAVEAQSAVGATAGPFTVDGGTEGVDYSYTSPVLTIHSGNLTISTSGETAERIVVDGAATITLAGVNISTGTGPALQIQNNATFDVNILLADGSNNILKTTAKNYAGLQKNGDTGVGTLTIGVPDGSTGTGKLEATGGTYGAGIGGGDYGNGSNITISGGEVTANGGFDGAGIGGGYNGSGNDITITGGVVTATGGNYGAGIGGGSGGSGSDITISGGVVTAYGGSDSYGIGDGSYASASGSGNSLNGDAVVLATSGNATKAALEGFVDAGGDSTITQGIVFTGLGTAFDYDGRATDITWDASGTMYGNVTLSQDLEIPANLTIPAGQILSIKEGKDVTLSEEDGVNYTVEGELRNNGTVTLPADIVFIGNGEVTTKIDFYLNDGSLYNTDYQTYQTNAGVQKYMNLPNPDDSNGTVFDSWFTKPGGPDGGGTKVDETIDVLLNDHSFYEHRVVAYTITVAELENGSITPNVTEAAEDAEVALTVTPDEGYQLKEGSLTVTDANGNEVPVTEQDGKYTFTMPGADVTVSAEFELIPIPTPPAPTPIPEPSVDPDQGGGGSSKTGDSFSGIAALAILGIATTGAVMLCKRK